MSVAADFARGGGGQISSRLCLRTGGPGSYAKISALKKGNAHLIELPHPAPKASLPSVSERV